MSDSPTGPFKPEPDGIKDPSDPKGYIWGNDPCVFVDDNGQAYLYWGGQGHGCMQKPKYVKLKSDMKTIDGKPKEIDGLKNWYEATYVHKRKTGNISTYYLTYATAGPAAKILYATGSSPEGPWNYVGEVIDGTDNCWTTHQSFVEFPKGSDKWYAFYHNADLSDGNGVRRSICVDRLYYNSDRTMQKVVKTRTGTGTSAYQRIKAQLYHEQCGKTKPDKDPSKTFGTGLEDVTGDIGKCVNWINPNDWLLYKDIDFGTPVLRGGKLEVQVASPYGFDREAKLLVTSSDGTISRTIYIPKTGGWQTWQKKTVYLSCLPQGIKNIKFTAQGKGSGNDDKSALFNFNSFTFSTIGLSEAPLGSMYFQSKVSGMYWDISGNNGFQLRVDSPTIPGSRYFEVKDAGNGYVTLKHSGLGGIIYVDSSTGELKTNGSVNDYAKFKWQHYSDGTFVMKNKATGNYVWLEKSTGKLYARSTSSVNDYYKFIFHMKPDSLE